MKLLKYGGLLLVIVVLLLTLLSACAPKAAPAPAPPGEPIKIGLVVTFSGAPAEHGFSCRNGHEMAVEEINAKGGVLGRPLKLLWRDSKCNVELTRAMAKELVIKEEVFMLVGAIPGRICLALSDYAKSVKVPYFNCKCATERLCGELGHRYVFSGSSMSRHFNKGNVLYMAEKFPEAKKYYIFCVDNETGHSMAVSYRRYLEKYGVEGMEIVGESFCKTKETDYTPYVTAILAAKPDVLYVGFGGSQNIAFMKVCKETGLGEEMLITSFNINDVMMALGIGDNMPDGAIGYTPYLPYYYDHPANVRFVEEYRAKYGKWPTDCSSIGYFETYFIAEALKKAGEVDREKFIDALEGLTIYDTPLGDLTMRAYDHQVMLPLICGRLRADPAYPDFYITKEDVVLMKAEDIMPTIEEIEAAREAAKE